MPLTELEREMAKAVCHSFCLEREAVSHEQLLRKFDDPRPIATLRNLRILQTVGAGSQLSYLPTILAFHYCGDDTLRENAKNAVGAVIRGLKTLFKENYDTNRQYPAAALAPATVPVPKEIALGLFLVREIPNVFFGAQQGEGSTDVISFRINEDILTLEPQDVWDEYVRTHGTIEDAAATQKAVQQRPPKPELKSASSWPPPRWKIQGSLGEGGQGWTYKVRRSGDPDRKVYVLKRLKNKERLPRFRSEIAALTKLKHPGILKIVETSEDSEAPFFVAEYCEGRDLGRADLSGKNLLTKLHIFRQVCDAVAAAHNANILHRDLKPPNIFIRRGDAVVVGDFGLCIDLNDLKERATQTLEGIGAERYIAPEVAKGRVQEPQPTSDLYSLGKILYFILSGRTLVREEYAEGEDDLRKGSAGLGIHFVYELFDKTITPRPQDRFQCAADLLHALDTVIERVQMRAHILNPSIRQHCMFCVIGEYRPATGIAGNDLMYVCSNCGNIQRFTGAPSRLWWESK